MIKNKNIEYTKSEYSNYLNIKRIIISVEVILILVLLILSVSLGAVRIPFIETLKTLLTPGAASRYHSIIYGIRMPQCLAAIVIGAGLAASGAVMQIILQNPLGAPYTLGTSNAAAFGAALSVMILGTGVMHSSASDAVQIIAPYRTTLSAFFFALLSSSVIVMLARLRQASSEVMLLTGITLNSLFVAGTMFLQYFADDVQLAAMVFWTFGDLGRVNWSELLIISNVSILGVLYFLFNRWNFNAMILGDETAKGLGVHVDNLRMIGMFIASFITAVTISFVGVISFVGLISPHITRRILGEDYRFFLPGSILCGSILLLLADLAARFVLAPRVLPVAVLTAFMGAPVFIYLLLKGYKR